MVSGERDLCPGVHVTEAVAEGVPQLCSGHPLPPVLGQLPVVAGGEGAVGCLLPALAVGPALRGRGMAHGNRAGSWSQAVRAQPGRGDPHFYLECFLLSAEFFLSWEGESVSCLELHFDGV